MRFVLVFGSTETARIDGISAAGADPDLMAHTPAADAEILAHGRPTRAPVVPVSPSGCPTPAVVTRAVRELLGFEATFVDAGAARPADVATVALPGSVGADIREPVAVGAAGSIFEAAREQGRSLPGDDLVLAETIPGGTTTAMGVLAALGERAAVSSSLPENPLALKRSVVEDALGGSGLPRGGAAGDPVRAIRAVGDPVLAAVAGLTAGALGSGRRVVLGGGTQMSAAAALVRHAGVGGPLAQATTSFVADDPSSDVARLAADLDVDLTVTDPGFERSDHPAMDAYVRGEAKEGVGMGGALAVAAGTVGGAGGSAGMGDLRARTAAVYDRLLADAPEGHPAAGRDGSGQ